MLQKLRTVIYHVHDLTKAKEWYTQLTSIHPYFDEVFYVAFDINGCELGLDPDISAVKDGNHSVAYWSVEEIDAAVKKSYRTWNCAHYTRCQCGGHHLYCGDTGSIWQ